jgi:hypothetical protein
VMRVFAVRKRKRHCEYRMLQCRQDNHDADVTWNCSLTLEVFSDLLLVRS